MFYWTHNTLLSFAVTVILIFCFDLFYLHIVRTKAVHLGKLASQTLSLNYCGSPSGALISLYNHILVGIAVICYL